MALSFKELLGGYKSNRRAGKGGGQGKGGGGAAAEDDAPVELGAFPKSVHKLWARRQHGWDRPAAPPALPTSGGKVAVCLTIVDRLPHEHLWRRWLDSAKDDAQGRSGLLVVHAKKPDVVRENQPWVGERTLAHSFVPEWNDIKVARAMLALLARALEDEDTQFMFLGTESCVPIRPLPAVADALWSNGSVSWLNAWKGDGGRASKFEQQSQFGQVDSRVFPPAAVWKALPGWICLARHHAQAVVDLQGRVGGDLTHAFAEVFAPEEIFFPSLLCMAGFVPSDPTVVHPQSTVFAKWPTSGPPEGRANPVPLDDDFGPARLDELRRQGFLFARKFKRATAARLSDLFLSDDSHGGAAADGQHKPHAHPPHHPPARRHRDDERGMSTAHDSKRRRLDHPANSNSTSSSTSSTSNNNSSNSTSSRSSSSAPDRPPPRGVGGHSAAARHDRSSSRHDNDGSEDARRPPAAHARDPPRHGKSSDRPHKRARERSRSRSR